MSRVSAGVLLAWMGVVSQVFADANGTWTSAVGGNWSDTNNWQNGVVAAGTGYTATFNAATVSVTNDAAAPVGVLKFSQGGVSLYGDPLVLDATEPKIVANNGIAYLVAPVVASNGLTVTKENASDNRVHFLARNEIGRGGFRVDQARAKPDAGGLAPLPGESGVVRAPFSTNLFGLTLSGDGNFNLIGSTAYDTVQHFASVYVKDKGTLEPYVNAVSVTASVTADELAGPGYLKATGNGRLTFGSADLFSGTILNPNIDVAVAGGAGAAPRPAAGAVMHLDASDPDSLTTFSENGTNFVVRWDSQVPGNWVEHDGHLTGGRRALPWVRANAVNGLPAVDFGTLTDTNLAGRAAAPYLVWKTRRTDIRAAFAVLRSQNFIFTDTSQAHYHHNREKTGAEYRWDQTMLARRGETHISFTNGEAIVTLNGAAVNPFSQRLRATDFDVVALVVKEGATAVGSLAYDRSYRYGGQQVAEELFYDRVLTDAEIEATVAYLRAKWQGVAAAPGVAAVGANLLGATAGGRTRLEVAAGARFATDSVPGQGTREKSGSGTLRAQRGALRPATPFALAGGTLELVNAGGGVDASLDALTVPNMVFRLDASDLSSMTLDGDKVLEWRGSSNVTNGLLAYALNTADNPAPRLRPGRLNGRPVVDFGAWQAGALMLWNHTNTAIRTAFLVFDHIHRESFWLADVNEGNNANFHRDSSGIIFFGGGYVAGGLKSGQVTVNGKRVDPLAAVVPEEESFLISFTCAAGTAARAACLATDRYPRPDLKFRSGGQRLAEVVLYDRHLSGAERAQVEGYLLRKWLPCVPAGFAAGDESQTFDGVRADAGPVALLVAEGQDAVLGALDGAAAVEKAGAGTLAVGSLAGLSGELTVKAGSLRIAQRPLPEPYTLPGDIAFHVDASDAASIRLAADGVSVTNISDASGGPRYAVPANPAIPPQLVPDGLNGRPVLSFRGADSGCAALWDQRVAGIRTVFWVLGSHEGGGMPLGTKDTADGSGFKRAPAGAASDPIWASDSLAQYGVTRVGGGIVNGRASGFSGGYQLMSLVTDRDLIASAFATHKNLELFGGQRVAEVIVYERLLPDQERRDVEAYLARKWFGAPASGYAGGDVAINRLTLDGGAVALPEDANVTIQSLSGTADVLKDGAGVLAVGALDGLAGGVTVSGGVFRLIGAPALPALPADGLLMHMDASVTGSFEVVAENGTNFVTRWNSVSGSRYASHDGLSKRPWLLPDELNGLPVVDFGPYLKSANGYAKEDGAYLNWNEEIASIRSGFFVLGSQAGGNFVVCSGTQGHFHRAGDAAGSAIIDEPRVETPPWLTSSGSYWSLDSVRVNAAATGLSGGYQSFCFATDPAHAPTNTVQGGTFARDRTWRWGGQRLAEFVIYDRVLSEAERAEAEIYLRAKWFGEIPPGRYLDGRVPALSVYGGGVADVNGQTREVGALAGDGTVSNGTLAVTGSLAIGAAAGTAGLLRVDGLTLAAGVSVAVDVAGGAADRVTVGGLLTVGGAGSVQVSHDGSESLLGTYVLFEAAALSGAEQLAAWRVDGLPEGVRGKLSADGSTVVLSLFAQGTLMLVR